MKGGVTPGQMHQELQQPHLGEIKHVMMTRDLMRQRFSVYRTKRRLHRNPGRKLFYCPHHVSTHIFPQHVTCGTQDRCGYSQPSPYSSPVSLVPGKTDRHRNTTQDRPLSLTYGKGVVQPAYLLRQLGKRKSKVEKKSVKDQGEGNTGSVSSGKSGHWSAHIRNLIFTLSLPTK